MNWTEVNISVNIKDVDKASDIATMVVPYGIYVEDYSNLEAETWDIAHIDLIDEDLLKKDRTKATIHIYISPEESPAEAVAFLSERFTSEGIVNTVSTSQICEEDWANEWKQYFKPLEIGEKLVIRPTWEEYDNTQNRKILSIDPGMAFGTGGHATTRLCLETMENYITSDTNLLDLGCGSGILSIAGLLLGAKSAKGVDIDQLAVKTAIENGELNGFKAPQYEILCGDLTDKITGKYEVVVANIVADVIILFCQNVKNFMTENGVFITSGIIDTRENDVLSAFEKFGLEVVKRTENDGWLSFVCKVK